MNLAEKFNHNFKIGDFEIYDGNKNLIYFENINGYWIQRKYDKNNNEIFIENSDGHWLKSFYDTNHNKIFIEKSNGFWAEREYDKNGNEIYYENSRREIIDNRPKTCIDKEIMIDGKKYQLVEGEE